MTNNRCFQRYSSCKVLTILSWALYLTNGFRNYIFCVNKITWQTTFKIVYKLLFPPFGLPNSSFSSQFTASLGISHFSTIALISIVLFLNYTPVFSTIPTPSTTKQTFHQYVLKIIMGNFEFITCPSLSSPPS